MPADPTSVTPTTLLRLATRHRGLILGPAVAGLVVAAVVSLVTPKNWSAEQGLLIRSDAAGYADQRLGKFTDLSEMKTVQETLLELARSPSVVSAALAQVDGDRSFWGGEWPTAAAIEDFRDQIRITPPGGAEFGKTEVFYLSVRDPNRDRAVTLVEALTAQLERRLQELRDERASSLVAEVERSVAVARENLNQHVAALAEFERSIGADLTELRHLTASYGGQSEFAQRSLAIEAELRQSIENRQRNEALLVELRATAEDPSRLLAMPDAMLASQPALRRLKNGLVDSQLAVARIAGARTSDHPFVVSARRSQQRVQQELVREMPTAIAGVELELDVAKRLETDLQTELENLRERSAELAAERSRYTELLANVEGQTRVLENALQQLADAESHRAGAASASLLARIDAVDTGARPLGPSRKAVTAAGGLAGLILGVALVWVLHGPSPTSPASDPAASVDYAAAWPTATNGVADGWFDASTTESGARPTPLGA